MVMYAFQAHWVRRHRMNSVFRDITAGKIQTNVAKFTRQTMYNETKYTVKATRDILNFRK